MTFDITDHTVIGNTDFFCQLPEFPSFETREEIDQRGIEVLCFDERFQLVREGVIVHYEFSYIAADRRCVSPLIRVQKFNELD